MAPVIASVIFIVIVIGLVDASVFPHVVGVSFFKLQKSEGSVNCNHIVSV